MSELVDKLNEIMAVEWACVRALRRAESACNDPGKLELVQRVHKECSVNCINLANVIGALGGSPTDVPSPRFSLKLSGESLTEALDMAQSAQQHILAEINAVIDDPDLKSSRSALDTIRRLHEEHTSLLNSAIAS